MPYHVVAAISDIVLKWTHTNTHMHTHINKDTHTHAHTVSVTDAHRSGYRFTKTFTR